MTCIVINEHFIMVSRENVIDCFDYSNHNILQISEKDIDNITDITISCDNKYLGIITSTSKQLLIYTVPELKLVKNFTLPRSASKINFDRNQSKIFVADKTGDVLSYDILNDNGGTKLLGHLSLLLNVIHTNDAKYLITSDRDEKIRVSHYPNTYNIQTYCMGHKEFVHYIELLAHNEKFLISASGDGTIKIWDYVTGCLHYTIDVNTDISDEHLKEDFKKCMSLESLEVSNLPIVHVTQTYLNYSCSLIAVSVHSLNNLLLYSIKMVNNLFIHKLETQIPIENFPAGIKFYKTSLFIYDNVSSRLLKYKISYENNTINIEKTDTIKLFQNHDMNVKVHSDIDLIKILFKRRFDNVQEYQERKKQRLAKPITNM